MIVNDDPNTFLEMTPLEVIHCSPYKFYLGGSRRMYQRLLTELMTTKLCSNIVIQDHTDYDFYATFSIELEKHLRDAGFAPTNNSVERHYELDDEAITILQRGNVQVVLRQDAEKYNKLFESIPVWFFYHYLWKSSDQNVNISHIQPIMNMLMSMSSLKR